ncbi:MAG: hypothetical protein A2821_00610 [Candidatus Magasanikbacteria bacterium RIFCSPHIGHO2_01_FULL_41_23]|uniref:Uncharacterized protein n=1 Tax=Candidatus Magasanikbacteria bacterium RIFCSPLOWO2_01_FULL_40_15 TaxID=1798686 RepID=A0A1F6N0I5_9BACT|nr:MAG: hypothetical protein A2821_00610 [Candidatus Magasanikbacteria bacterium RIFCSPHIGHO2_01_FULL_41_23]OGH74677.1 MAG: hypothetical protein A3F22_01965 [Candidatus Magasanikbacteria bacterium RIFCSPHIGHO2_12_FULL_41_16]OGH77392.1 MAG: hypothetical protein A2983_01665 [Candidatus Magasanikbacteria bacterium RIFCSPLOWO2_01_FULL_40_15]
MHLLVLQRLFIEFIFDIFYFPFWWYTSGMMHTLRACLNLLSAANNLLAPRLWLKNVFVPMFGQHDWQGRLISFIVRLTNVIGRTLCLLVWFFVVLVLFLLWLVMPVFVIYMLIISSFSP